MSNLPSPPVSLICLCAGWCRTCEEYRGTLQQVVAALPAGTVTGEPRWLDIEEHSELVQDIEIETFPTVIVHRDTSVLFAGPVLPSAPTLRILVSNLQAAASTGRPATDEYSKLLAALLESS